MADLQTKIQFFHVMSTMALVGTGIAVVYLVHELIGYYREYLCKKGGRKDV